MKLRQIKQFVKAMDKADEGFITLFLNKLPRLGEKLKSKKEFPWNPRLDNFLTILLLWNT